MKNNKRKFYILEILTIVGLIMLFMGPTILAYKSGIFHDILRWPIEAKLILSGIILYGTASCICIWNNIN